MNTQVRFTYGLLLLLAAVLAPGCGPSDKSASQTRRAGNPLPPEVTAFVARKEKQARALAAQSKVKVAPEVWSYFAAAKQGNWPEVARRWESLKQRAGQYEGSQADPAVASVVWQPVMESFMAREQFAVGEPKYAAAFGSGIIESIPRGSIYFGGTDPGRGLVTALCKSHEQGDPFFTITQNALADSRYLDYVRSMYGGQIYIPTMDDSQKAFQTYLEDAQRRLRDGQIKPGEDVRVVKDSVQVSGQVAVMAINALLVKVIFDGNPEREVFIEESFPLDWMYPHLEPHGLIMKVHREPLTTITPEVVAKDREFWAGRVQQMIGNWLKPDTSVKEVCDFAERVFVRRELNGFTGDPAYVGNTNACAMFSKLRSSIAGVYHWRMTQAADPVEKQRMLSAADLAFRQAFALCPWSPEAIFRYVQQLVAEGRMEDARLVASTAFKLDPENAQVQNLVQSLEQAKQR